MVDFTLNAAAVAASARIESSRSHLSASAAAELRSISQRVFPDSVAKMRKVSPVVRVDQPAIASAEASTATGIVISRAARAEECASSASNTTSPKKKTWPAAQPARSEKPL